MSRDPVSRARCLAVSVGGTLAAALLLAWLLPHQALGASAPPPVERFDAWLVLGCEAAAAVGVAWLWLLVCLVSLEAAGTTSRRRRGVPAGVRRAVLADSAVRSRSRFAALLDPRDRKAYLARDHEARLGLRDPRRVSGGPGRARDDLASVGPA